MAYWPDILPLSCSEIDFLPFPAPWVLAWLGLLQTEWTLLECDLEPVSRSTCLSGSSLTPLTGPFTVPVCRCPAGVPLPHLYRAVRFRSAPHPKTRTVIVQRAWLSATQHTWGIGESANAVIYTCWP